ncbi:MAG: hypothetical protein ABW056_04735, partial [Thermoanaerobaculia bacterium]
HPEERSDEPTTDPTTGGKPPAVGNAARSAAVRQTHGGRQRRPQVGGIDPGLESGAQGLPVTGSLASLGMTMNRPG